MFWKGVVKGDDVAVMDDDVGVGKAELPGEDIEELAFYSVHVSFAKHSGGDSPVNVPQGGIISVL